ncbi:hypothetical protein P886_0888 [Alteromonadaceae bacterium 2753L.S.0a.02]|nr:hypothetical protein P886_0888 [Alteromonadaceae bacterium 2753L.S.0a.02]
MLKVVCFSFLITCATFAKAEIFLVAGDPLFSVAIELCDSENQDTNDCNIFDSSLAPNPGLFSFWLGRLLRLPSLHSAMASRRVAPETIRGPPVV